MIINGKRILMIFFNSQMQQGGNRKFLLKLLLIRFKEEIQSRDYNINESLKQLFANIWPHHHGAERERVKRDLINISFCLSKSAGIWMDLLMNDQIESQTTMIYLNYPITLTKVFQKLSQQITQQISNQEQQPAFSFTQAYLNEENINLFAEVLNSIAIEIAESYAFGKAESMKEMELINMQIRNCKIMNSYMVFGILKQMSSEIQRRMTEFYGEMLFRNVQPHYTEYFSKYILRNYMELDLIAFNIDEPHILTESEEQDYHKEQTEIWMNYLRQSSGNVSLKKVESSDGEVGVMVEEVKEGGQVPHIEESSHAINQNLILKIESDKIVATNSKNIQKSWKIHQVQLSEEIGGVEQIVNSYEHKKAKDLREDLIGYGSPTDGYVNMGGTLGKCLANIDDYSDPTIFFTDLTKKVAVAGSLNIIMFQIPVVQYLFVAGGLSFTLYHSLSNDAIDGVTKFKQISSSSLSVAGSVGAAIAGMTIGQILIPVPVLGAFVGGLIGGFIGQKGAKTITGMLDKQNFKNLILYLKKTVIADKKWVYNKKTLQLLGINEKFFITSNPDKKLDNNVWLTAACFCIVSVYESDRYIKFNENKLKQIKKIEKENKKKEEKIKKEGKDKKKQAQEQKEKEENVTEVKDEGERLMEEKEQKEEKEEKEEKTEKTEELMKQKFRNEFDLVRIICYLSENSLILLQNLGKLESLVTHIILEM